MSMIQGAAKKDVFTSSAIAKAALAIKKTDRNKNNTILNTILCLPPLQMEPLVQCFQKPWTFLISPVLRDDFFTFKQTLCQNTQQ